MNGGSVFQTEGSAAARRLAADLRRHRGALRRAVSRRAGRRRPRRARPRRRPGPVRPQDPQDPDHPDGPQLDDGRGPPPALRRLRQRRRATAPTAPAPRRSGPSTSTATSPAAACTGGRAPAWPSNWAGASSTRACRASAAATRSSGRTSPWRAWPTRSWRSCTRSRPDRSVLLGHSMGGAVAVQFAHDHPRRTLGMIYRDGVSTPAWKDRSGHPARRCSPRSCPTSRRWST